MSYENFVNQMKRELPEEVARREMDKNEHQYFTYFMIRRTTMTEKQYGYSMKGMYELIKRERARAADREKEAYRERQRRKFLVEEGIVIFDVTFHYLGVWVRGQPCANIERRWKHPDDIRNEVRVVFDTVIAAMGVDEVCKRMTIKKYGLEGLVK